MLTWVWNCLWSWRSLRNQWNFFYLTTHFIHFIMQIISILWITCEQAANLTKSWLKVRVICGKNLIKAVARCDFTCLSGVKWRAQTMTKTFFTSPTLKTTAHFNWNNYHRSKQTAYFQFFPGNVTDRRQNWSSARLFKLSWDRTEAFG